MKSYKSLTIIFCLLVSVSYAQVARERMISSRLSSHYAAGSAGIPVDSVSYKYSGHRGVLLHPGYVGAGFDTSSYMSYTDSAGWQISSKQTESFDPNDHITHSTNLIWRPNTHTYYDRYLDTYDTLGHLILIRNEIWDTTTAAWIWIRTDYTTYDTLYLESFKAHYYMDTAHPVGAMKKADSVINTYNSNGSLSQSISLTPYDSAWINSSKVVYSYSPQNVLVQTTGYIWGGPQPWSWVESSQTTSYPLAGHSVYTENYQNFGGGNTLMAWDSSFFDTRGRITESIDLNYAPYFACNTPRIYSLTHNHFFYDSLGNYDSIISISYSYDPAIPSVTDTSIHRFWYETFIDSAEQNIDSAVVNNIKPIKEATAVSVYPNPAQGNFTISFYADRLGDLSLRIYDTTGQLVTNTHTGISEGNNTLTYDVTQLSRSIYFYELDIPGSATHGKIVLE